MTGTEKAIIGDLIIQRQASTRRLACLRERVARMVSGMRSAARDLEHVSNSGIPSHTEFPTFPDREDVEQVMSGVSRELETLKTLRKKLSAMGISD